MVDSANDSFETRYLHLLFYISLLKKTNELLLDNSKRLQVNSLENLLWKPFADWLEENNVFDSDTSYLPADHFTYFLEPDEDIDDEMMLRNLKRQNKLALMEFRKFALFWKRRFCAELLLSFASLIVERMVTTENQQVINTVVANRIKNYFFQSSLANASLKTFIAKLNRIDDFTFPFTQKEYKEIEKFYSTRKADDEIIDSVVSPKLFSDY